MEIFLKVAITAIVLCLIYYQFIFLNGLWRSQIDPKATINRVLGLLKPQSDVIVTRDPTKVYQSGEPVGDVTGPISEEGTRLIFKELSNASALQLDQPIEYKRLRLKVVSVGPRIGIKMDRSKSGTITPITGVLTDVVCEIVP